MWLFPVRLWTGFGTGRTGSLKGTSVPLVDFPFSPSRVSFFCFSPSPRMCETLYDFVCSSLHGKVTCGMRLLFFFCEEKRVPLASIVVLPRCNSYILFAPNQTARPVRCFSCPLARLSAKQFVPPTRRSSPFFSQFSKALPRPQQLKEHTTNSPPRYVRIVVWLLLPLAPSPPSSPSSKTTKTSPSTC